MTAKVGQIYTGMTGIKIVISKVTDKYTCIIFSDGFTTDIKNNYDLVKYWELVTEYPTWIEAVNSKEFMG